MAKLVNYTCVLLNRPLKDDSRENITKNECLLFQINLITSVLPRLNLSNMGEFSWSWILNDCIQVQKKKDKFAPLVVCSRPHKIWHWKFHVVVAPWTSKKWTKKCNAASHFAVKFKSNWLCHRSGCFSSLTKPAVHAANLLVHFALNSQGNYDVKRPGVLF